MNKLVVAVALTLASIAAAAGNVSHRPRLEPANAPDRRAQHRRLCRRDQLRATEGTPGRSRARSCTVTKEVEKDINGRFKKGATHSEVVCQ